MKGIKIVEKIHFMIGRIKRRSVAPTYNKIDNGEINNDSRDSVSNKMWFIITLLVLCLITATIGILLLMMVGSLLKQDGSTIKIKINNAVVRHANTVSNDQTMVINAAEFVEQSNNVSTVLGESVKLSCSTDRNCNCYWQRNEAVIEINGGYEYLQNVGEQYGNGDCSILIRRITDIDFATWKCGCYKDGGVMDTASQKAHIINSKTNQP